MTETLYIRPIALAASPQDDDGEAIRLAGGLACASRFALIRRRDGVVTGRKVYGADALAAALSSLPFSRRRLLASRRE